MDIAKQIATNQEELVKTPPKITATDIRKDRRSSVPAISGPLKPKFEKSKTIDTASDEIIIEARSGGTWFGSKRIKEREIESSQNLAEKLQKQAEDAALEALEKAVDEVAPKKVARGATRDSYKNATTGRGQNSISFVELERKVSNLQ